ncbi:hypothetical protein HMPREF1991_00408 [Hoylesella loescheii DSM 19665 = JCM 12249 = ATCC 15930]|uniref:Uncharacterized protein n=1 Tax=Hoylesella loescheii DSM 19665 = JCM 12249 = ATCC 15930 TaxID=1122985 RepID=A0A069QKN9_HOYLO|nr:hypothetical protein HMPREF1991_00408 [Hoylesella loescheii DSM 19665 = JCM 12249 = ATCC 15930]
MSDKQKNILGKTCKGQQKGHKIRLLHSFCLTLQIFLRIRKQLNNL